MIRYVLALMLMASTAQAQAVRLHGGFLPLPAGSTTPILGDLYIDPALATYGKIYLAGQGVNDTLIESTLYGFKITGNRDGTNRFFEISSAATFGGVTTMTWDQASIEWSGATTHTYSAATEVQFSANAAQLDIPYLVNEQTDSTCVSDVASSGEVCTNDIHQVYGLRLKEFTGSNVPEAKLTYGTLFTNDSNEFHSVDGAGNDHELDRLDHTLGEIYIYNPGANNTIDLAQNTWVKMTGMSSKTANNTSFTSDCIVVTNAGRYKLTASIGLEMSGAAADLEVGVCLNSDCDLADAGAAAGLQEHCVSETNCGNGDDETIPITCSLDLAASDAVCIYILNQTNSNDVDVDYGSVMLERH